LSTNVTLLVHPNYRKMAKLHVVLKILYTEVTAKVWSYFATHQKKLATHKCMATPWLRTTALERSYFKGLRKYLFKQGLQMRVKKHIFR
jgi:hypothetical protein